MNYKPKTLLVLFVLMGAALAGCAQPDEEATEGDGLGDGNDTIGDDNDTVGDDNDTLGDDNETEDNDTLVNDTETEV